MPVALTDHIDRSPDKQLLRGKKGTIHSWVLGEHETSSFEDGVRILKKMPKLVLVKFRNPDGSELSWKLEGLTEYGLYPIQPKRSSWFLDKGRMHPMLKIRREQLPLAPAFAMTSHASQGQTLKQGAIVDLCIGKGTNPLGSYVAMTRVTHRMKLLIYRPFQRDLFAQGEKEGPLLLLRHLRGEKLDWKEIEKKYMPSRRCQLCGFTHFKDAYQDGQWNRLDQISFCKQCIEKKKGTKTPYRCNNCGLWLGAAAFDQKYHHAACLRTRICVDCELRRRCNKCEQWKSKDAFGNTDWDHAQWPSSSRGRCRNCNAEDNQKKKDTNTKKCSGSCQEFKNTDCFTPRQWTQNDDSRKCKSCATKKRGYWICVDVECKEEKPTAEFSLWLQKRSQRKNDGTARCNECFRKQNEARKSSMKEATASVTKKKKY